MSPEGTEMAGARQLTSTTLREQLGDGTLAGRWQIDGSGSTIALRTRTMWGLVPVKGVFRTVTGEANVSGDGDVQARIEVLSASVDTKNAKRDVHLRSKDFFATDSHPSIVVEIDKVVPSAAGVTASGRLVVRGVANPIELPLTVSSDGDGVVLLEGSVVVDRSLFGIDWNRMGMASTKTTIDVHARFAKL